MEILHPILNYRGMHPQQQFMVESIGRACKQNGAIRDKETVAVEL